MSAAGATSARVDHGLEQGAVYRMPGGRWAVLERVQGDALRLRYVDARRAVVLPDALVQLSVRMAPRLRLAWRANDWAARRRVVQEIERAAHTALQALLEGQR